MSVMYSISEVLAFAMQYPLWKIRPNLFPQKCVGILLVIRVGEIMGPTCWIYTKSLCNSARGCDRRWCLGKQTLVLQSGLPEIFQTQIFVFITWTVRTRQLQKLLSASGALWKTGLHPFALFKGTCRMHTNKTQKTKPPRQLAGSRAVCICGQFKNVHQRMETHLYFHTSAVY